ncbi:MAG TPA: DUF4350 domain-containing protein [Cyclobacteriaceae bacterium]|nr:DUF4350 domain-containing protein [Cyclobacteriaceae bacterium]
MRKDWKYILYLTLAFGIFLAVKLSGPKEFDWTPTYASEDKNPFGAFVLRELIPALFKGHRVQVTNKTLYELRDSLERGQNILVLAHAYAADDEEVKVLLNHVYAGGSAFIGAETIRGKLADTLWLSTRDYIFQRGMYAHRKDTSFLKFLNPALDTSNHFVFRRDNIHNYVSIQDTSEFTMPKWRPTRDSVTRNTSIIAENDLHDPVLVRIKWGKGIIVFCSTPLAFTNIYALRNENHQFISTALSYLPEADVTWSEYYSVGRLESNAKLRFILTQEPLAWAYYISVLALLLFMAFEAKRKQRIIPIMNPLTNSSLEFVSTIGNLYFSRGDHKNIADKKILFFSDYIRTKYSLNPGGAGENFISLLSKKSGKSEDQIGRLFQLIRNIQAKTSVTESDLRSLNNEIEEFTSRPKQKKADK